MSVREYDDCTERCRELVPPPRRLHPVLTWQDGAGKHSHRVEGQVVLGSSPGADVRVTDRTVSRLHAELEVTDQGVWVRDLGSLNGTFVQGIRVTGAMVPNGAELQLGSATLNVVHGQDREPVALWPRDKFGELVGASACMREVFAQLARLATAAAPVMIRGETGTGKELAARAIHDASSRSGGPFVVVDCAALPPTLVESELFGHARGAFTGALNARAGAFEAAHGGTVFLDEAGELPLSVQPKLLRVLESSSVRRVGETEYRPVDVRVLSATHRDLRQMVNAGAFREDLYFRLAVLPVVLPPLRARPGDIPMLVERFLGDRELPGFDLEELVHRPWLGNVRELRNFVEQACTLGTQQALSLSGQQPDLPDAASADTGGSLGSPACSHLSFDQKFKSFREAWIDCGEQQYVEQLLKRCDYNVARAAREAGLDRTYVYRLIRKFRL